MGDDGAAVGAVQYIQWVALPLEARSLLPRSCCRRGRRRRRWRLHSVHLDSWIATHNLPTAAVQLLPAWVTTVLLAALLLYLSHKLIVRGFKTYRAETAELKEAAAAELGADDGAGGREGLERPSSSEHPA